MKILAIESSCDETSASIVIDANVLNNFISSQNFHSNYGGVIPELASRAHLTALYDLVDTALISAQLKMDQLDAIAVTTMPGLSGSLIVGSNFAKGLSIRYDLPIVPINHIEGHLFSGCMQDPTLSFPFIALVVSGGHTALFMVESFAHYSILGLTKDDAAGEAFDKIAKLMGLPYPGGPEIDKLASGGDPKRFDFPRSMLHSGDFNFSFSGLKTAVRYFIKKNYNDTIPEEDKKDISAGVQQAIIDVLFEKTKKAAIELKIDRIVVAGGVSANSGLRNKFLTETSSISKVVFPDLQYCMDNAAMIGFLAEKKFSENIQNHYDLRFTINANPLRAKLL